MVDCPIDSTFDEGPHHAPIDKVVPMSNSWFSTQGFMPHGHCYLWKPELVWLHVVSDSLIFLAYVSIPATLVYFVRRRKDLPFDWMFMCFGVFIVSCGLTHLMEVWTLWNPSYWLSGGVKVVTAIASLCTAALLMRLMPQALALPSPSDLRRVAAALEASEARLRAAAEGSNDAFCILDALRDPQGAIDDFQIVYANSHTRSRVPSELQGDLVGKSMRELGSWAQLTAQIERCKAVMASGAPVLEEVFVSGVPGQADRWVELQIVPLGGGVAVTSRDITRRKRDEEALRRAEERWSGLLESAPDAMVIVDSSGQIVFVNKQTENLFGYARDELLGKTVETLLPQRAQDGHIARRREYSQKPRVRAMGSGLDLYARRKDGSEFPVEICLSPLETESGTLVSSAIRDVTTRRMTENSLKLANQELEAFSYSVAHDLRAPLRGMSGFAQILLEDYGDKLDGEGRDCLNEILANAQRMGQLIDALLSLSRVTRTELRIEPVDVSAIASAVAADLARTEPERAVEVRVQPGLSATMDQSLARTLVTNLLGNAWKFTKRAANPRIEIGATSEDGAFFVRDNGAGFDKKFANKLFAPFQRLHTAREFPGTGIGLATVQRIVHRHGGRVWAEGSVDSGATFYFRLPANAQWDVSDEQGRVVGRGQSQR